MPIFGSPHPPTPVSFSQEYCLPRGSGTESSPPFSPLHCLSRLMQPALWTMFFSGQKVRQEVRQWWLLKRCEGQALWKQMRVQMLTESGNRAGRLWLWMLLLVQQQSRWTRKVDKRGDLLLLCILGVFASLLGHCWWMDGLSETRAGAWRVSQVGQGYSSSLIGWKHHCDFTCSTQPNET